MSVPTGQDARFSVAMATFNGEHFLPAQLASIAAQTETPHELVIVDDGSSDRTLDLIDRFSRSTPFSVQVIRDGAHLGSTRRFESAIRACTGDIIVTSDQDDVWLPEKLERVRKAFDSQPGSGVILTDAHLIDEEGVRSTETLWTKLQLDHDHLEMLARDPVGRLLKGSIVYGCTMAFRSSLKPVLLPFPEDPSRFGARAYHDWWIALAAAAVSKIQPLDEPLIEHRLHQGQQVGFPRRHTRHYFPARVKRWRQVTLPRDYTRSRLATNLELLDEIDKRVATLGIDLGRTKEGLDAARAHLDFRLSLNEPMSRRIGPVFAEARRGAYRRFSVGIPSAVADILRG